MDFIINGNSVSVLANSLQIDDRIGERSTASFAVSTNSNIEFEQGQFVGVYDYGNTSNKFSSSFNGVNAYIDCGNAINTQFTNKVTLECWVNLKNSDDVIGTFLGNLDAGGFGFQYNSATAPRRFIAMINIGGTYRMAWGFADVVVDRWYHVAITYDGSQINFYVDGANEGQINIIGNITMPPTNAPFTIGANPSAVGSPLSEFFNGCVDDVRVWNVARTQTQIQQSMNSQLVGNEAGLVAYYKLEEGGGTTAIDSTGHGYTGTLKGATYAPSRTTNTMFSGAVEKSSKKKVDGNTVYLHAITCKDWHYLSDKRIIAKVYANVTAGSIVKDLIAQKLAVEGVSVGIVEDGDVIQEAVFNYIPVSRAIDAICEKTGLIWYVDFDKRLYFRKRTTLIHAPWTVTGADVLRDLTVDNGNSKYRNTQYIKGGTDITDPQTEQFLGDGKQNTFSTGFKIAKVPSIKVNGVAQTVGIRGLESGKQWYWNKGDNAISQDNSGTPLTSSQTLAVTYQGEFAVVVISRDDAEIITKAVIEQNSGINDDVADEPETTTRESAFQSASAKLGKFAVNGRQVKFRTRRNGLEAGQIATVNIPEYNLNNTEMLVESVGISDDQGNIFYEVSCIEGPEMGSWTKLFEFMATRGQAFVIRENIGEDEVLITLASFSKTWNTVDSPNIFKEIYPSATLFPSDTLFPMFAYANRVSYLSWFNGTTELGRKVITKQNGASTGNIFTTVYLSPFEANTTITHLGWYGGLKATSALGTGVLVDKQVYSRTKTNLEAIQVEKTDTRNFVPNTGTLQLTPAYFQAIDDRITALTNSI